MVELPSEQALAGQRWTVPVIAAYLAPAGLPIYIQLPRYAADLGIGLGTILLYGQGAELVGGHDAEKHLQLAGRREAGALAGVVVAAVAPGVLQAAFGFRGGWRIFGIALALSAFLVWQFSRSFWVGVTPRVSTPQPFRQFLRPNILPVLQASEFRSGAQNTDHALHVLTLTYAVLPCVLKLLALVLVARLRLEPGR